MELGVDDGENARSMVNVAKESILAEEIEYYGFDYFSESKRDQVQHKLEEMGCMFKLFKGDILNTLPKVAETLPKMDLIFIDGGKF